MVSNRMGYRNTSMRMLLALLITMCFIVPGNAYAAAGTEQKIDAVLAMDASTSMNESDANKVANEAMKMFIDMLSVEGDKVGVISYTDQIVREKALLQIKSQQDKQELRSFIDQLTRGPYTDISVGVREAVKILESGKEAGHYPLIVLLSDGNNWLNAGAGRTQAASDQELQAAVQRAKELAIPIYTIGLNADGQLNKDALSGISKETGGKFFETSSADGLPQILSEIFASHLKLKVVPVAGLTGNGEFQDISVSIPNANVREANISIISGKPVEVRLYDPAGKEQSIPSDGLAYTKSTAYSLLKLIQPAQGDWKLQVKGADKDKINVNLVYNYDLALVMSPLPSGKTYKPGDAVEVSARLESAGQPVVDTDLYKNLKGVVRVTDPSGKEIGQSPLTNSGSGFAGQAVLADAGDYLLSLKVEDANFFRETVPVAISVKGAASASPAPAASATSPASPASSGQESSMPWLWVIIGAVVLAFVLFLVLRAVWMKRNKGFFGQCMLEICEEDTGRRSPPQYRPLRAFRGRFTLHQLLQLAPELAETEKIVFTPGSEGLILHNQSECIVEKSGRALDAARKHELKNKDRLRITLKQVNKSILLEYIK